MRLIPFLFLLSQSFAAKSQVFKNLDFKQSCDSSKTGLCYWDLSWGNKGSVTHGRNTKINWLEIKGNKQTDVGFAEQSGFVDNSKGGQIITVSAFIRSDNIKGKGAGLDVQIFDKDNSLIAFKDMGGFYSVSWIQGTSDWTSYSISVVCPPSGHKIKIGAILYGSGGAYFSNYKVNITPIANRRPGALAQRYISAVCDTIQKHSLVRDSLDIESLKETALKIAGNAKRFRECYLAVNFLLDALRPYGDEHSFFMTPAEVKNLETGGSLVSKIENPSYKIIDSCGYIFVPPFHGTNTKLKLEYADSLQMAIKKLDASGIQGWIIDLRENTGGDMEPMIEGLGPLFSAEKLGSLIDVNGNLNAWHYQNGKYFWDDGYSSNVLQAVMVNKKLPIAVLTSQKTGSSGEAVLISFIGNDNTKFLGQPTWGLTTGNGSFDLMDGANIHLASTIMADRSGKKYYGPIQPDVIIKNDGKDSEDKTLWAAIHWIASQD